MEKLSKRAVTRRATERYKAFCKIIDAKGIIPEFVHSIMLNIDGVLIHLRRQVYNGAYVASVEEHGNAWGEGATPEKAFGHLQFKLHERIECGLPAFIKEAHRRTECGRRQLARNRLKKKPVSQYNLQSP